MDNSGSPTDRPDETVARPVTTAARAEGPHSSFVALDAGQSSAVSSALPALDERIAERYRVVRLLGSGGHGSVYEVVHVHLDRRYALKVLGPADETRATKGRFEREAHLLSRLNHQNIVGVVDAGFDPVRGLYLVLELVSGRTLGDYLHHTTPVATSFVVDLVTQLAAGLTHAHGQKIIHRDLKPENIMLAPTETGGVLVKILDFGIAKLLEPGPEAITRSGWSLGTAAYMAPEQARGGRDLDERVDVFALGVVVYEALAGKRPFDGASYNETLFKVVSQAHASILEHRPDLPVEVASVLDLALSKSRDARYSTVLAFAQALTEALKHTTAGVSLPRGASGLPRDNSLLSTEAAPISNFTVTATPARKKRMKEFGLAIVLLGAATALLIKLRASPPSESIDADATSTLSATTVPERDPVPPARSDSLDVNFSQTSPTPSELHTAPAASRPITKPIVQNRPHRTSDTHAAEPANAAASRPSALSDAPSVPHSPIEKTRPDYVLDSPY